MFCPLEIIFNLDGSGIYYDPYEPIMLDSVLAAAVCRWHVHGEPPARDEIPFDIPLPLRKWNFDGVWGWHASALFPDNIVTESLQYWRKRFRQSRIDLTTGLPNLASGSYRNWNMPIQLFLVSRMVGYVFGDARRVRRELRRSIKYLGKKRAYGRGAVISIDVKEISDDYSLYRNSITMRWLPNKNGTRFVRPRPPYWNSIDRVLCAEIGCLFDGGMKGWDARNRKVG